MSNLPTIQTHDFSKEYNERAMRIVSMEVNHEKRVVNDVEHSVNFHYFIRYINSLRDLLIQHFDIKLYRCETVSSSRIISQWNLIMKIKKYRMYELCISIVIFSANGTNNLTFRVCNTPPSNWMKEHFPSYIPTNYTHIFMKKYRGNIYVVNHSNPLTIIHTFGLMMQTLIQEVTRENTFIIIPITPIEYNIMNTQSLMVYDNNKLIRIPYIEKNWGLELIPYIRDATVWQRLAFFQTAFHTTPYFQFIPHTPYTHTIDDADDSVAITATGTDDDWLWEPEPLISSEELERRMVEFFSQ
jgi:hypothetical protein